MCTTVCGRARRKTSSAARLRTSTLWNSTGASGQGRTSMPTTSCPSPFRRTASLRAMAPAAPGMRMRTRSAPRALALLTALARLAARAPFARVEPRRGLAAPPPHARREHRGDRLLHLVDVSEDDRVVLVARALEDERRAVLDLYLRRERHRHAVRDDGDVRHAEQAPEAVRVGDGGEGFAAAEDRDRHDGRARLEREAHEAAAEVDERVALAKELRRAARALGEDHEHAVVLEQALGVLGQRSEVPGARRPRAHEGEAREELLGHPLREARRLELEEARRDDHRAVDGDAAGVVADDHRAAARRHVLDAARLDGEVPAVEGRERRQRDAQVALRDAERVDADAVEGQLEPLDAIADVEVEAHGGSEDTLYCPPASVGPASAAPASQPCMIHAAIAARPWSSTLCVSMGGICTPGGTLPIPARREARYMTQLEGRLHASMR